MREANVVTCFLIRRGEDGDELLLLRRSDRVSTYRGLWAGVSGYLEAETPLAQAYRELEEEIGLGRDDVRLITEGEPLIVPDESINMRWTVYPFLFEALRPERLRLDWEHTDSRWLRPQELAELETVPGLAEGFERLYSGR